MKNRLEAEEYIKNTLRSDETVTPDRSLKDIKWKKITIKHESVANTLAKLAIITPMPKLSREVIIYKLANPGISDIQMAIMAGVRAMDIMAYEAEGKARMTAYLEKYTEQEIINKAMYSVSKPK